MRFMLFAAVAANLPSAVSAQVHVGDYTKSDGTYVAPHYRSSPDNSTINNYSSRGNVNPYTGRLGTKNPYGVMGSSGQSSYSSPYAQPVRNGSTTKICTYYSPC